MISAGVPHPSEITLLFHMWDVGLIALGPPKLEQPCYYEHFAQAYHAEHGIQVEKTYLLWGLMYVDHT